MGKKDLKDTEKGKRKKAKKKACKEKERRRRKEKRTKNGKRRVDLSSDSTTSSSEESSFGSDNNSPSGSDLSAPRTSKKGKGKTVTVGRRTPAGVQFSVIGVKRHFKNNKGGWTDCSNPSANACSRCGSCHCSFESEAWAAVLQVERGDKAPDLRDATAPRGIGAKMSALVLRERIMASIGASSASVRGS